MLGDVDAPAIALGVGHHHRTARKTLDSGAGQAAGGEPAAIRHKREREREKVNTCAYTQARACTHTHTHTHRP